MNDLVSVIMPAYNAGKFIGQSILSIVHQTYENWELIIVNDGSTDNTEEVILKYAKVYIEKIHFYRNPQNCGAAATLNVAMAHAKGKYMCWLSADDLYFETMIESQVGFLEENIQYDAVFSKSVAINEKNELLSTWNPEELINDMAKENSKQPYYNLLMIGNSFPGCALLGKRESFIKTGEFNTQFLYAADYEYWVRMAAVTNIGFLNEYNTMSREYPEQTSKLGRNDVDAIKVFCHLLDNEEVMRQLFEKIGEVYSRDAVKNCFLTRILVYRNRNKELCEVLRGFEKFMVKLMNEEKE